MRFVSWNVNGLRAVVGKNFNEVFTALDADFFCLQETKMQEGQLDLAYPGYTAYWNYAEKKGYSGTAIYTRARTACDAWNIACSGSMTSRPICTIWTSESQWSSAAT